MSEKEELEKLLIKHGIYFACGYAKDQLKDHLYPEDLTNKIMDWHERNREKKPEFDPDFLSKAEDKAWKYFGLTLKDIRQMKLYFDKNNIKLCPECGAKRP